MFRRTFCLKNQAGQGLVEYVIVVALVAVACMGMVRVLQDNVKANLANVIYALKGDAHSRIQGDAIDEADLKKSDFSNFMKGAATGDGKN
jgi:pilus assembly protein Flp/PilA